MRHRSTVVGLRSSAVPLVSLLLLIGAGCGGAPDAQVENRGAAAGRAAAQASFAGARQIDWTIVDAALGRTGVEQPGNVRRYGMPRSDMRVTVQGVRIRPSFALGSWLAMTPHGDGVLAMGDMVLKESEVGRVMSALQTGGVGQTAVHHHLLHETPRVVYMHVHGMGDPVKIAQTVRAALARTSTRPGRRRPRRRLAATRGTRAAQDARTPAGRRSASTPRPSRARSATGER